MIESLVARSAVKPISGFVDALLGPKLERIRNWSKNKDLESYLKEGSLAKLLEGYVERTAKSASMLSTIVFPQRKINIHSVYEPVSLGIIKNSGWYEGGDGEGEEFIISPDELGRCYLVVDDAGMGKSTFAKSLCLSIIESSERIPVLFDLSEFDGEKTLLENIANEFDSIDGVFSRELLGKLIVGGYLFIVLDGFDEVSSKFKDFLIREIKELSEKKGKSSLMVTSRPQERLPDLSEAVSIKLKNLSNDKAVSIFKKYDAVSGMDIGKKLQLEMDKIPARFLRTPLLVGLLYRTYGFNQSIAEKITVFYSEIYEALYKGHDLTKSGYVRDKECGLDIDKFRQLLRSFSYLYVAMLTENGNTFESLVVLVDDAQKLCAFSDVSSREFLNDLLLAVPLLTRDGNTLKFMHRSIAEYFAAEFIANASNRRLLLENIVKSGSSEQFRETVEYLYELAPSLYLEVITSPVAEGFIEANKEGVTDELYSTVGFSQKWAISFWKMKDVEVKKGKRKGDIDIPKEPEHVSGSASYMYGDVKGERYVACISSGRKSIKIPAGAWLEITRPISVRHVISSDENLEFFIEKFSIGKWYESDDPALVEVIKNSAIQELLRRQNMFSSRTVRTEPHSTRVILLDKCRAAVESLCRIRQAEEGLANLLKVK